MDEVPKHDGLPVVTRVVVSFGIVALADGRRPASSRPLAVVVPQTLLALVATDLQGIPDARMGRPRGVADAVATTARLELVFAKLACVGTEARMPHVSGVAGASAMA